MVLIFLTRFFNFFYGIFLLGFFFLPNKQQTKSKQQICLDHKITHYVVSAGVSSARKSQSLFSW